MAELDLFRILRNLHAEVSGYLLRTLAFAIWLILNLEAYYNFPTWAWSCLFLGETALFLWWLWWATDPSAGGKSLAEELAEIHEYNERMPDYGATTDDGDYCDDDSEADRRVRIDRLLAQLEALVSQAEAGIKNGEPIRNDSGVRPRRRASKSKVQE